MLKKDMFHVGIMADDFDKGIARLRDADEPDIVSDHSVRGADVDARLLRADA